MRSVIMILLLASMMVFMACDLESSFEIVGCNFASNGGERPATLVTGRDFDQENVTINSQASTFDLNEEFYFLFRNNKPFESTGVTLNVYDESNEVIFDHTYEVEAEWDWVSDTLWSSTPGTFRLEIVIGGEVRASTEVTVR